MNEKELSRCEGCGAWVYGIRVCGMCELAKRQTEKQIAFQSCKHLNLTVRIGVKPIVECLNCNAKTEFEIELNPMLETEKLRSLLEGERK